MAGRQCALQKLSRNEVGGVAYISHEVLWSAMRLRIAFGENQNLRESLRLTGLTGQFPPPLVNSRMRARFVP
jgi:hypothetical protein